VSAPGQKDKLTPELRILVASLLSFGVIILWAKFLGRRRPSADAKQPAGAIRSRHAGSGNITGANPSQAAMAPAAIAPATAAAVTVRSDSQESHVRRRDSLYRVEISKPRRGGVKSWQLKHYKDDSKPQRVLDVVHPDASQQTGGWPFSVVLDDEQLQNAANGGLYQISSPPPRCKHRPMLNSRGADGRLEVTKHFRFDQHLRGPRRNLRQVERQAHHRGAWLARRLRRFDGDESGSWKRFDVLQ